MANTGKVVIVYYDGGFIVDPGHRHAVPGEDVIWKAIGTKVTLLFPDAELFGTRDLVIEANGEGKLTVQGVQPGIYPYAVYVHEENDFARGGTHPAMIIE